MNYVTGSTIRTLREKQKLTQKQLADQLAVSDKTVSKWETGKGLPDIGIITDLALALGISLAELLTGEYAENRNRAANMQRLSFYVCPLCGNIIQAVGSGSYSCCGILLPELEVEEEDEMHEPGIEIVDQEYFVSLDHEMSKEHYISFFAYVSADSVQLIKLYPEQSAQARFTRRGHGCFYAYCNRHGLYQVKIKTG